MFYTDTQKKSRPADLYQLYPPCFLSDTGITGEPHRPSSIDGHSSLPFQEPYRAARLLGSECPSLRLPYQVRLSARTVRH